MSGPGEEGDWPGATYAECIKCGHSLNHFSPDIYGNICNNCKQKEAKMNLNFDATKIEPNQGTPKHPTGKFPAIISETGTDGKDETGYFFVVFSTPSGSIRKQYNLWTKSTEPNMLQMVSIAQNNLSALCHATGVFRLGDGRELVNARCMIEVTPQTKNPQYHEVSKVYDANGNEPGKPPAQPTQGGWPAQTATAPAPPPPPQQGWSNPAPAQNNAPAPAAAPANTWQQGPSASAGAPPPWAASR